MKALKYFILISITTFSLTSCMVRERGRVYIRGHYEAGPHGSRHWVPAHYAR